MSLQSMTGFAAVSGQIAFGARLIRWNWALRSVNSKGLDIRTRLPAGAESLDSVCRRTIQAAVARGSVTATLSIDDRDSAAIPTVNAAALEAVLDAARQLHERIGGPEATVSAILGVKGVFEPAATELDADQVRQRDEAFLAGLGEALGGLVAARRAEGAAIASVLEDRISRIEALAARIEADPSRTPEAIRDNLRKAVARLLETGAELDESRLLQEAAMLAVKADIREELDRLGAHVVAARKLLGQQGPIGRKLDFLAQEFNRECNTVCSKSTATAVTELGLEMKIVIDQLREQVQNVE
jgi:uncharacterized protein (TIGR00255 family)